MIELFTIPMLCVVILLGLLFALPRRGRLALFWIGFIFLAIVWVDYFFDAASPGHDGGPEEALGLLVFGVLTFAFVVVFLLAVGLSMFSEKPANPDLSNFGENQPVALVGGRHKGETGYVVSASSEQCKDGYLVALDSGFDVVVPATDLVAVTKVTDGIPERVGG